MKPTDNELQQFKAKASAWAQERLSDPNTVVVDVETTGLLSQDPTTEIVQLSVTNFKGRPLFSMLLKPDRPMGQTVIGIHGITNEEVESQPTFPQVAKLLSFVLEGKHLVAYNADFDVKLIWHLYKKYECKMPKLSGSSCCMDRYSEWCGEWSDKKGGFKWQKLPNLTGGMAHDAFVDCVNTLQVMKMMTGEFNPQEVEADDLDLEF
jgi:DNA polymerase-3 subunit epsilon